jgi:hypothetical protein
MFNKLKQRKSPLFFKKKLLNVPTIFGWLLAFSCISALTIISVLKIHSFLAISRPLNSKILIVEGWVPDYCLEQVNKYYHNNKISTIFITGGPLEQGSYLKEFKNFAALGGATLKKLGIPDSILIEIPAPYVQKDRTYTSAITFKRWLISNNEQFSSANIITLGVHARRSSILFQNVLGNSIDVGVISIIDKDYNPDTWYASSCGFKMVITEIISYLYTKVSLYSQ